MKVHWLRVKNSKYEQIKIEFDEFETDDKFVTYWKDKQPVFKIDANDISYVIVSVTREGEEVKPCCIKYFNEMDGEK